jgi:hypothetical protein
MSTVLDDVCKRAVKPGAERLLAGMALAAAGGFNGRTYRFICFSCNAPTVPISHKKRNKLGETAIVCGLDK